MVFWVVLLEVQSLGPMSCLQMATEDTFIDAPPRGMVTHVSFSRISILSSVIDERCLYTDPDDKNVTLVML